MKENWKSDIIMKNRILTYLLCSVSLLSLLSCGLHFRISDWEVVYEDVFEIL